MSCPHRTEGALRRWSRRRVLSVVCAAASLPILPSALPAGEAARPEILRWHGRALGAVSTIALAHPDTTRLRGALGHCLDEIRRLESIFSLFEPESELSRLNRHGRLDAPSIDLRTVLAEAQRISLLTGGAFDVTVQPLWDLYSAHFRDNPGDTTGPSKIEIERTRRRVGFAMLEATAGKIAFARGGMAATLNGIAQGYITDRIADMLRSEGFEQVLVDVGELAALTPPTGVDAWRIAVKGPARHPPRIALVNQAVATSSGDSTKFDGAGRYHHLFVPAIGRSAKSGLSVTVVADNAMTADALSTALAVAPELLDAGLLRSGGAQRALMQDRHGQGTWIGAA